MTARSKSRAFAGALLALALAGVGCADDDGADVKGPFTGTVSRYVVDRIVVPRNDPEAKQYAGDLDGDGEPENQLGVVTTVLASTNDLSVHAPDMIASGALAWTVEIQADDLADDATVGVRVLGADDEAATVAGGVLAGGAFRSNRTATTRVPGAAILHLPVFTNADPLVLALEAMELDLDPDGAGGFDAVIRGGLREDGARDAAHRGLVQMFETEPERHLIFSRVLDPDRDGVITRAELDASVIGFFVTPDIQLRGVDLLSVGIGVHLTPCESGRCSTATPSDPCRDRVRDGDETDVDCGGSCQRCAAGKACGGPADCQTAGCDAGVCRAASCGDGVRDGYESDLDCGGVCGACQVGQACAADTDCASGACTNTVSALGSCVSPAR